MPDEIYDGVIQDLKTEGVMFNLVKKISMKRDVMRIPKLQSRPHLRWTSENAAKSINSMLHLLVIISCKLAKLQGKLIEYICSQAQKWEGSTTIMREPLWGYGIV